MAAEWLRSLRRAIYRESEPFVFLNPDGSVPVALDSNVQAQRERLRVDPQTAPIMEAIESGPNAELYQRLRERIKTTELDDEEGEYLMVAAAAPFFGHKITDATLEGIISCGGSVGWRESSGLIDFMHLSEVRRPSAILLEERVQEIMDGEFSLPTNEEEVQRNVASQMARIGQQLFYGSLSRKARTMGIPGKRGDEVGHRMISSLKRLSEEFISDL